MEPTATIGRNHGTWNWDLELDETLLDETGKDRQKQDRTGKGGEDWERDCNIKPTACSRCNSGGPRPGSSLGRMAWDDGVCGTWTNAWRRREERALVRGVPPPGPVCCLPILLSGCLACRQPEHGWAGTGGEIGRIR